MFGKPRGTGIEVAGCVALGGWVFYQDELQAQVAVIGTNTEHCEVCHLRYWHKDLATATDFSENSACRQYKDNSCCTAATAEKCVPGLLPCDVEAGAQEAAEGRRGVSQVYQGAVSYGQDYGRH